ncbi:MAG: 1-acyl-sn-glycerol-3-phosphate acyltransferase [Gammaproteobacteria bacterium]|nr:1-acyl-sn-glycerol-3-phosphate acyltransferase [Gammaproteobacteria bacterium]
MLYYILRILKYLFFWLDFCLFTLIALVLSWLPKFLLDKFYPQMFQWWCKSFIRALNVDLRLHQKNLHPIPKQYILVGNHPSAFEDLGIPALFPVHSLAKIEVRDWFLVGRVSWAAGTLYVRRESKESRNQAAAEIEEGLKDGKCIALYPEGGCKGRRIFENFRYGAFDISLKTGIPILPVFLHYEAQDDFEWRDPQTLIHKIWHFMTTQNNRANYYVLDAIDPKQFSSKEEYTEYTHKLYLKWQEKYLE